MEINKFRKIFGIGPFGLLASAVLLLLLWLLDHRFGHVEISRQPAPLKAIGFVLLGIWICWHIWAARTLRSWWSGDELCTMGPFRFVRHPMYAGAVFLVAPGVALLFNSWIVLLLPVVIYPVWSGLVGYEEKMMAAVFGDCYQRYAARTGRLFPRLWH